MHSVPRTRGDEPRGAPRMDWTGHPFPAHAGMNRPSECRPYARLPFPAHAGMNRLTRITREPATRPFPAHAGMNRCSRRSLDGLQPVPRTRGDEPFEATIAVNRDDRSPHTRG